MVYFFKGNVALITKKYIVFEVNNIGYQIFVSDPNLYKEGENTLIYIHEVIKEDESYYVGFRSSEDKNVFLKLLDAKGIGPKTALQILKYGGADGVSQAIKCNNIAYLKKIPGIGTKVAYQIMLDLKDEFSGFNTTSIKEYDEAKEGLKSLGFKKNEIENVLAQINIENATSNEIMKEALSRLRG